MSEPWPWEDPIARARAKLFDDLRYGRVSGPDEAERIAAEQGLEPLNPLPNKLLYDPSRISRWPLVMAVAWIAWRDIERVREAWDVYRRECHVWNFRRWRAPINDGKEAAVHGGWFLEQLPGETLQRLRIGESLAAIRDENATLKFHSVHDAQQILWESAGEGRIVGEAIRVRDDEVVEIPAHEWRLLTPVEDHERDVLAFTHTWGTAAYKEVVFPRLRLVSEWPASGLTPAATAKASPARKAGDVQWAVEQLFPDHPRPFNLSKDERGKVTQLSYSRILVTAAGDQAAALG